MDKVKKPYHPMYIANYIIKFCTENKLNLNNLKLQKIMYYLQAQSLVESDEALFDENLQKWKYGPVVATVYHEYKVHGASGITTEDISPIIRLPFEGEEATFMESLVIENFDENKVKIEDRHTVNMTLPILARYDSFDLVNKTHKHSIWKEYIEEINSGTQNMIYTNKEIKDYFITHPQDQLWKY